MIRISVDSTRLRVRLKRVRESTRRKNSLFQNIQSRFLTPRIRQIFASNGDGRWAPTQRTNPILRDTYALFKSYTVLGAPGSIRRRVGNQNQSQLIIGSSLPYADIHEEGTRTIVARPILGLVDNAEGDRKLGRMTDDWYQNRINRSR